MPLPLFPRNPDFGQPEGTPFEEAPNLAVALMLITEELRRRDRSVPAPKLAKAKEPDTFDSSDPKKLNNFILLCNLYFRTNPSYEDDTTKVTFALSYLRGLALEYFEPSILNSDETPDWIDNWSALVRTLLTQFGPIDPTADTEDSIDNLKMQENQHIVKYNVEFTCLAIRTRWDESVLRNRYYSGLVEHIKDIMGQQGKPQTLDEMKYVAHSIDARYWEQQWEKSRAGKNKPDGKPDKSDNKPTTTNPTTRRAPLLTIRTPERTRKISRNPTTPLPDIPPPSPISLGRMESSRTRKGNAVSTTISACSAVESTTRPRIVRSPPRPPQKLRPMLLRPRRRKPWIRKKAKQSSSLRTC